MKKIDPRPRKIRTYVLKCKRFLHIKDERFRVFIVTCSLLFYQCQNSRVLGTASRSHRFQSNHGIPLGVVVVLIFPIGHCIPLETQVKHGAILKHVSISCSLHTIYTRRRKRARQYLENCPLLPREQLDPERCTRIILTSKTHRLRRSFWNSKPSPQNSLSFEPTWSF